MPLDKESSKLCTFNTPFGRYSFLRLPFGISNASEIFHWRIKQIIEDFDGTDVYIDDTKCETIEEHNSRLEHVNII